MINIIKLYNIKKIKKKYYLARIKPEVPAIIWTEFMEWIKIMRNNKIYFNLFYFLN
jgi:hypothetical protein